MSVLIHDLRRLGGDLNAVIESRPPPFPGVSFLKTDSFDHIDMHRGEKRNKKKTKSPQPSAFEAIDIFFFFLELST